MQCEPRLCAVSAVQWSAPQPRRPSLKSQITHTRPPRMCVRVRMFGLWIGVCGVWSKCVSMLVCVCVRECVSRERRERERPRVIQPVARIGSLVLITEQKQKEKKERKREREESKRARERDIYIDI